MKIIIEAEPKEIKELLFQQETSTKIEAPREKESPLLVLATEQRAYKKLPSGSQVAVSDAETISEIPISQDSLYRFREWLAREAQDKP